MNLNFEIIQSDTVKELLRWYGFQPISNYYGDTENVITFKNDTMLLDMIQTQVQNKYSINQFIAMSWYTIP